MKFRISRSWRILRDAGVRWNDDECGLMSAAMAYYAACSLFPLCLVLTSAMGWMLSAWQSADEAQHRFLALVREQASPWLADQLSGILQSVQHGAHQGGRWGMVGLFVAAMGIFYQFDTALERIWRGQEQAAIGIWSAIRRAATSRLSAFLMLVVLGALMGLLMLIEFALVGVRSRLQLPAAQNWLWAGLQSLLTLAADGLLLSLLFKTLPPAAVRWRAALVGGAFTALVWKGGQWLLAALVIGDYYSPYGVIGAFLAVMLWLYYLSAVLFLGAEVAWVTQQISLSDEGKNGHHVAERRSG